MAFGYLQSADVVCIEAGDLLDEGQNKERETDMELKKFLDIAEPLGLLGIKVTQGDRVLAEASVEEECRRNVYSASKSFTSCAVGLALHEGLLSLDERLVDAFAKDLPDEVGPNLEKAVVRDLLTMCLGQESASLMGAQRPLYEEDDWVKLSLRIPFVYEPGTHFVYNNVGPYLAGVLVQRRAGCDLVSYLTPRLFRHLGIKRPMWETDPLGNTFGAGGLFLTLSELHRFGLLYLHKGEWEGRRIVQESWVEESSRQQGNGPYGYLFWRGEQNSYRADGKYSQLSIILPDKDAVVSVAAWCRRSKELMRAIYDEVCAQL